MDIESLRVKIGAGEALDLEEAESLLAAYDAAEVEIEQAKKAGSSSPTVIQLQQTLAQIAQKIQDNGSNVNGAFLKDILKLAQGG